MIQSGFDIYRQNAVSTNTKGNILILLYEGAIRFIDLADAALKNRDILKANENLIKAQKIFYELKMTLNYDEEELALSLDQIYNYFINNLIEANIKKDASYLVEIRPLIVELCDTWKLANGTN